MGWNNGAQARKAAAKKKVSELFRSGKAAQKASDISTESLEQVVSDAQGRTSQRDRKAARSAATEIARRGGGAKPKKKRS